MEWLLLVNSKEASRKIIDTYDNETGMIFLEIPSVLIGKSYPIYIWILFTCIIYNDFSQLF